jgi:hypothetical protein
MAFITADVGVNLTQKLTKTTMSVLKKRKMLSVRTGFG